MFPREKYANICATACHVEEGFFICSLQEGPREDVSKEFYSSAEASEYLNTKVLIRNSVPDLNRDNALASVVVMGCPPCSGMVCFSALSMTGLSERWPLSDCLQAQHILTPNFSNMAAWSVASCFRL